IKSWLTRHLPITATDTHKTTNSYIPQIVELCTKKRNPTKIISSLYALITKQPHTGKPSFTRHGNQTSEKH
ncbi:Hypothetical predicted protein, partial [Pelobates cultripes]